MSRLAQNYNSVKDRIAKASAHSQTDRIQVQLLAVSKTRPSEDIRKINQLGQQDFGENYLQEALEKITALTKLPIRWHFIGPIQSNKTRQIAENFDWVHTVDRAKIAQRLNDQRPDHLAPISLCIQINLDNESTKSGIVADKAFELASLISALPKLRLRGLMFIPAPQSDYKQQLQTCQKAKTIFDTLKKQYPELDTLSLGMSSDLEAAIEAGSNMVRIGSDIFGERNYST